MRHEPRTRRRLLALGCALIFLAALAQSRPADAAQDYWPTETWREATPESQGMESRLLLDMMARLRERAPALHSLMIVRNGYIVTEVYFHPFAQGDLHITESVAKSVTSALVGIALDQGAIGGLGQSVLEFFPERAVSGGRDDKAAISLEHLLTMTSGLETRDSYLYRHEGFFRMLESPDWVQHVLDRPLARTPGETFDYSNGGAHLLSAVLQSATGTRALDFARTQLFGPLGITAVAWASDPQGITIGEGQLMLSPRDMAKFGLLYLNRGRWDGRQLVSESWIEASTVKQVPAEPVQGYGYLWWVDPAGYYLAMGHRGQFIFVVPDKALVMVATGDLGDSQFFAPKRLLDRFVIPAAVSTAPLPEQPELVRALRTAAARFARAPEGGVTWSDVPEGRAEAGVYSHTAPVGFSFSYPKASQKRRTYPHQVMAMTTPMEGAFAAAVGEVPEGRALADFGPQHFAAILGEQGAEIELRAHRPLTLADGTPAYRTDIDWRKSGSFAMRSLAVSAYRAGHWVTVSYATPAVYHEATLEAVLLEGEAIVESLVFD